MPILGGGFGCGITVIAYAPVNRGIPTGGCQESGGVVKPMIMYGEQLWTFGEDSWRAIVLSVSGTPLGTNGA